jgi:hypothetical protein
MNLFGIGTVIESVGKVASDLITTDKERLDMALREKELDQRLDLAQIEVNKSEAQHATLFVAGARPAILWVGAFALMWTYIAHPMLVWLWAFLQSQNYIPSELQPPPTLGSDTLWVIISGILGLGGYRTFEKSKGVAS